MNDVILEMADKMEKSLDSFKKELSKVRTGRASTARRHQVSPCAASPSWTYARQRSASANPAQISPARARDSSMTSTFSMGMH